MFTLSYIHVRRTYMGVATAVASYCCGHALFLVGIMAENLEFPIRPTSTEIGVGVADVINHTKFDNDRSKEYEFQRIEFFIAP